MSNPTYFVQECPTCGRGLQIRVEYLGRRVVCQHCQGHLVASEPENIRRDPVGVGNPLLRRAEELLETFAQQKTHAR